ncbi:apolipoprotein N-acyltransferase [Hyphobacterium sp.]|uniref:apolipoprotein N-acyltransferase n=1 Tax=Hyphobacterium sp. TaxID=2004662 RepID=UPI003BABBBDD
MSWADRARVLADRLKPSRLRADLLNLTRRQRALALIFLGLFAGLSAAPLFFFPALALGLTALIWLLDGCRDEEKPARSAAWRTFLFSWAYLGAGVFWVAFAFWNRGGAFIYFGPLVAIGGAAFLAAFWAAAGAIYVRLGLSGPVRVLAFAILFLAAESVKGLPFTQFPWNLPAHVFEAGGAVSQSAAWFGTWGLSFLTLLMFASPAALAGPGNELQRRLPFLISLLVLASLYASGTHRLNSAEVAYHEDLVFRLVDVDIDQREKWAEGGEALVRTRYLELTAAEGIDEVTHVVWPEGALPLFLIEDSTSIAALTEILTQDQVLLAGTPRRERAAEGGFQYFNSLVAIQFTGQRPRVLGLYDKVRLVPFGEYVPLSGLLSSLGIQTLQELVAGYSPGIEFAALSDANAPPFLPLICYEVVFSGIVPGGESRPDWLLNISNDAWFGPTAGPVQHRNIAQYRSIETGLPMIRAASRGYSGVIDPFGRNVIDIDRRYEGVTDVRLPESGPLTIYLMTKGLFFWVIYILSILTICAVVVRNQRQT